jgi:hypothetical protein
MTFAFEFEMPYEFGDNWPGIVEIKDEGFFALVVFFGTSIALCCRTTVYLAKITFTVMEHNRSAQRIKSFLFVVAITDNMRELRAHDTSTCVSGITAIDILTIATQSTETSIKLGQSVTTSTEINLIIKRFYECV